MKNKITTLTITITRNWANENENDIIRTAIRDIKEFNDAIYCMTTNEFDIKRITRRERPEDLYGKEFTCDTIDQFFHRFKDCCGCYDIVRMMTEYGSCMNLTSETVTEDLPDNK